MMNAVQGSLLVMVIGLASLTGCAGGRADDEIHFLRQKPSDAPDMAALYEGQLVLSERCLYIQSEGGSSTYAAIWPFEFGISAQNDSVDILNRKGQVVARVGDQIRVGGGEVRIMPQEEFDRNYLGAFQCSEPYWLVTEVVETTP